MLIISRANSEHHFETKTDEPHSFTDVEPLDQGHVQHHGHVQLDQVLDQGHVQLDQSQYDSNHVRHDQGHVQHGHIEEGEVAHNIELRGEDGLTLEVRHSQIVFVFFKSRHQSLTDCHSLLILVYFVVLTIALTPSFLRRVSPSPGRQ